MSELFSHYKHRGTAEIDYRWVLYDNEMPDEVLRGLMGEGVEPVDFDRKAERTIVGFYSTAQFSYRLLDKVREWERKDAEPLRAERRNRQAAESEAGFEEYLNSLNLDNSCPPRPFFRRCFGPIRPSR